MDQPLFNFPAEFFWNASHQTHPAAAPTSQPRPTACSHVVHLGKSGT